VQNAILRTTFNPGPVMQPMAITASNPTTLPNFSGTFGLSPKDYGRIYGYQNLYNRGLKGQGQIVDIAACGGFSMQNLTTYQTTFGLSPAPQVSVQTNQFFDSQEADLAVQRVYGTAPAAKIRIWFANGCTLSSFVANFFLIATDQRRFPAAAFTVSLGAPELFIGQNYSSQFATVDTALSAITGGAAQKVALFAASGDNGDFSIFAKIQKPARRLV
jgi:subtilase family serine protease